MTALILALLLATPQDEPVRDLKPPTATATKAATATRTDPATTRQDDPWAGVTTWASYWPAKIAPAKPVAAKPLHAPLLSQHMVMMETDPAQARATAAALQAEMDAATAADAVLATRAGQRLIYSAVLCEAQLRKSQTEDKLELAIVAPVLAADANAGRDIVRAKLRLQKAGIVPLACNLGPVAVIVDCLNSIVPSQACVDDDELAAQVAAAERLQAVHP